MSLHEGELYMYSKGIGHGCTFTMELPILSTVSTINDNNPMIYYDTQHSPASNINNNDSNQQIRYESQFSNTSQNEPTIYNSALIRNQSKQDLTESLNVRRASLSESVKMNEIIKEDTITNDNKREAKESKRVLVVDDVAMNRRMLIRCIKHNYPLISEAGDGLIAVTAVADAQEQGQPFDIVLLDYEMPNMIGPIAAKTMRNNGYTGIIIGVTGNGLPSDITYFLSHGADRVLIKPVNTDQLELCIGGIIHINTYHYIDLILYNIINCIFI